LLQQAQKNAVLRMAERIMAMLAVTEGTLYSMKTAKSTGPPRASKVRFSRPLPAYPHDTVVDL
jgi:hypothetical protein